MNTSEIRRAKHKRAKRVKEIKTLISSLETQNIMDMIAACRNYKDRVNERKEEIRRLEIEYFEITIHIGYRTPYSI